MAETLPLWPVSRLGDALRALAKHGGLSRGPGEAPNPPEIAWDDGSGRLGRWIVSASAGLNLEAELTGIASSDFERSLRAAGPALIEIRGRGFLAVLAGGVLLDSRSIARRMRPEAIRSAVFGDREESLGADLDRFLAESGLAERRLPRVRATLLGERLGAAQAACWLLRPSPGASFQRQLRMAGLPRRLLALAGAHAAEYALWILSWWMVGQAALEGRFDRGWLLGWMLLVLTLAPLKVLATWLQGTLALSAGGLLKRRLLFGALRLEPDETRHQGAGQLLGRVIESEAVEFLALSGGFQALVSLIELILATAVLAAGAGGSAHAMLLVVWVGFSVLLAARFVRRTRLWSEARLEMTHDLVERLVGHRTRLVQEAPERWHEAAGPTDGGIPRGVPAHGPRGRVVAGARAAWMAGGRRPRHCAGFRLGARGPSLAGGLGGRKPAGVASAAEARRRALEPGGRLDCLETDGAAVSRGGAPGAPWLAGGELAGRRRQPGADPGGGL